MHTPAAKYGTLAAAMLLTTAVMADDAGSAASVKATELSTVTVEGKHDGTPAETSYQGGTTRVGKIDQLPRDVPQSLTLVTEKLLEDRSADTLKEALRNVSGLTFNAGEGGRNGDNVTIRGYSVVGDLYLDGMRDIAQYNREMFNLSQVEVLRGSASMLFGRGSTGGIVNQVSKQALLRSTSELAVTIGSYDYKRLTADVNKQINDDTAFRVNLLAHDAGSFRDGAEYTRYGFAPTWRTGIGTANEFSASYYYLSEDNIPDYGIPYYLGRPAPVNHQQFYGLANADFETYETHIVTLGHLHRFDDDTSLRTALRYGHYDRDLWPSAPRFNLGSTGGVLTDATTVTRSRPGRTGTDETLTLQSDFTTTFKTGGREHQFLAGAEILDESSYTERFGHVSGVSVPTTTADDPDTHPTLPGNFFDRNVTSTTQFDAQTIGVYVQDTMALGHGWKWIGGLRYDDFSADYERIGPLDDYSRADRVWSWRTGLLYQPDDVQSYYISYGTSFNPSGELYALDPRGANTDPEMNRNMEIGAKFELMDGNLSLRTALFRSEKTNERNTDPLLADVYLLSGKRHTDGFEIEAAGRITDDWEVFGGVAFMRGEIDEAITPSQEGKRPINTPDYTANGWTTYKINANWTLGGGFEAVDERFTSLANTTLLPAYTRWDSMLTYETERFEVQFNIFNIFDKRYYEGLYTGHTVPGTSRTGHVKFEVEF